jgi:serine/threonine-protein kinase RsbW
MCGMPRARWSAPATAANVKEIREAVVDFAYASGITERQADDIGLATSEAVTNAVLHAYRRHAQPGSVCVFAAVEAGWLELRVVDDGIGMAPRQDSPGAGLGLPLISRLADQVEVRRLPDRDGTELWMRFRLDEPASTPRT